ncbi:MAG: MBL fold hydrolase [Chitinophagales bacterium]|nr:MAG: MBL fold hydrolase [Chitinophagales bacterium]
MTQVTQFTFNMFQENTYLLFDETGQCVIIDPGCHTNRERQELTRYIDSEQLKPVMLINTHCHVDHIMGNRFIYDTYQLKPVMHRLELPVLQAADRVAAYFGVQVEESPLPEEFLEEGDIVQVGNMQLEVIFTPGHSPGEICLYCRAEQFLIAGDVLFYQSIGRTDLPGGDYETLIASIKKKILPLGDEVKVYSGHGPETTIGFERRNNPFLL